MDNLSIEMGWACLKIHAVSSISKNHLSKIIPSTINACWQKLWPEIVLKIDESDKIDNLSTTVNQIIAIALNVEDFDEINRDNIE